MHVVFSRLGTNANKLQIRIQSGAHVKHFSFCDTHKTELMVRFQTRTDCKTFGFDSVFISRFSVNALDVKTSFIL